MQALFLAVSRRSRRTGRDTCYCRKLGYQSVQAATNGIEFAKRPEFAKEAAEAGLRYAYLQFDGIGNAANLHRRHRQPIRREAAGD